MEKKEAGYDRAILLLRLTMGIGLFLIWLTAFVILERDFQSTREREEANLLRLSQSVTEQLHGKLDKIHLSLKLLDQYLSGKSQADPHGEKGFVELVNVLRDHGEVRLDFRLIDDSGGIYAIPTEATEEAAAYVGGRDFVQSQRGAKAPSFYLGDPFVSPLTKRWAIPISYPLAHPRRGISLLLAIIDFQELDSLYTPILPEGEGALSILRSDGMVLYRLPYDPALVGKPFKDQRYYQIMREHDFGVFSLNHQDLGGKRRFIAYGSLSSYPLRVAISQDYQSAFFHLAIRNGLGFLALIGGSIVLLLLSRRLRVLLSSLKEAKLKIERISREDSLTGLANRGYFLSRLRQEMERSDRYGEPLALAILDIDFFKDINDFYGHPEGDRVLREIAAVLSGALRSGDLVGRLGGEEFGILLAQASRESSLAALERIREQMKSVLLPEGPGRRRGTPTLSAGICLRPPEGPTLDAWYQAADAALYRAKQNGRDRVELG